MADGIELNAGSGGSVISTDDIASVHYQIVKLALGALDSATLATGGNGNVDAGTLRVTIAADTTGVLSVDDNGATLSIDDGGGVITVDGTVDLGATDNAVLDAIAASVAAIDTDATTIIGHVDGIEPLLGTIDADTGSILTAVELIDDAVYVDDADWTDNTSKHVLTGGLYQSTPQTVTDGDVAPFNITANGALHVAQQGTVTVDLGVNNDVTVTGTVTANLAAGTNNIGDVDILSIAAGDNNIGNVDIASIAAGDNNIGNVDVVTVPTDPFGANADAASATGSISAKLRRLATDLSAVVSGAELQVDIVGALPAGTNGIGKLTANSGVDIGDVDVTSIAAGTNLIGDVGIQPRTTNGLTTAMFSGSDGSSILVATAQVVKASAGKLYGYYAYNPESAVTFVHFYNTAAASVTVGTTNPLFTLAIPPASAANLMSDIGITFSNAGWSVAATTTAGGNTAPATGVSLVAWYA